MYSFVSLDFIYFQHFQTNYKFSFIKKKKNKLSGSGQVAQLVKAKFQYAKVVGSIPGQGTYKNQPMKGSSHQDGGLGRNPLLLHTTKRRITTNLKSVNNQKHQEIKLHGTPKSKELKKKSTRTTRPVRLTARAPPANSEKPRRGS